MTTKRASELRGSAALAAFAREAADEVTADPSDEDTSEFMREFQAQARAKAAATAPRPEPPAARAVTSRGGERLAELLKQEVQAMEKHGDRAQRANR